MFSSTSIITTTFGPPQRRQWFPRPSIVNQIKCTCTHILTLTLASFTIIFMDNVMILVEFDTATTNRVVVIRLLLSCFRPHKPVSHNIHDFLISHRRNTQCFLYKPYETKQMLI